MVINSLRFVDVNFKLQDEVIASMISKAQRNMHGIVDLKGQNFGHGLYPLASFINHRFKYIPPRCFD